MPVLAVVVDVLNGDDKQNLNEDVHLFYYYYYPYNFIPPIIIYSTTKRMVGILFHQIFYQ